MKSPLGPLALLLLATSVAAEEPAPEQLDFFERKIRPVLVARCYECHSAKAAANQSLKGGLLLDSREASRRGGESGPAVVPGKPGESLLIAAIKHESTEMPPEGKLPDDVIAHFVEWIGQGAADPRDGPALDVRNEIDIDEGRTHWAFQPLRPIVPPEVRDPEGARTPIDRFLRARQEEARVTPAAIADPRTLIRRASFDLVGLPPTPQRVERYLVEADKDPTAAYERLVDELLAGAHYGERWARHWLDVARFAESNGYAFDRDRPNAWPYRDFVIQALNDDMPYDAFVRRQIAGDLLTDVNVATPEEARKTIELLAATGFVVAGPFTTQQTQKERERSRYEQLDDMINTLGTSLLGLTVGCCRCHDHKYDPLPIHDYYRLASCFAEVGFADTQINTRPEVYRRAKAQYDQAHAPRVAARSQYEQEQQPERFEAWLAARSQSPDAASAPLDLQPWHHIGPFPAADFNVAFERAFPPEDEVNLAAEYAGEKPDANDAPQSDKQNALRWTEQPDWKDGEAHNDKLKGTHCANYLFRVIRAEAPQPLALSLGSDDGIKLWVNGREVLAKNAARNNAAADQEKVTIQLAAGRNELLMKIVNRGGSSGFYFQSSAGAPPDDVAKILDQDPAEWKPPQRQKALEWFRGFDLDWLALNRIVQRHEELAPQPELTAVYAAKSRGTTYQFGADTYKVYHLRRGNADNKEAEAEPGFLQVLMRTDEREAEWMGTSGDPAPAGDSRPPRLALADWLTDMDTGAGPLLARVIVNRLWHHHFGRGIVATPSDFGIRGERPSHPALLEWLAGELVRGGWKLKPIHRLIMTSDAYMRSVAVTDSGRRNDPENLLLWRRGVRRLEAEVVRDALLAVSGRLDSTMYGPGTLDQNSPRRSIYLTVKRSNIIPLLQLFDAPDAMQGVGARQESTVAPQALAMLNSAFVRDTASRFAGSLQPTGGEASDGDDAALVRRAYLAALSRSPTAEEVARMTAFIKQQAAARQGDANARQLAVRDFCHLLLCTNEFIYVD